MAELNVDGTAQEQLTDDTSNDWFPHPSPDGRRIVFLSFDKDVIGGDPVYVFPRPLQRGVWNRRGLGPGAE